MKLFKLTVICGSVLSLVGCLSAPTNPSDTTYKPAMSPAYVDLLIEKAKAEERARVMSELAEQNKGDKRFSDIKINQLESEIEQLNQSSDPVKYVAPKENVVQAVEPEPVIATIENTSNDPLLEQWKSIYAQEEQASTPVVEKPTQVAASQVIEKTETPVEASVVEEVEIYTPPPVYDVKTETSVVNQVSAVNTFKGKQFDTVIRQCLAGQTIPKPYLGSLPEVLNSSAKAGDSIKLPTLCKWSRSPEIIKELQVALSERGFLKPSPPHDLEVIDGIWGMNTLNSLIKYQKSMGLAYGQLSIESLVDLGVIQHSDIVNRKGSNKMFKSEVAPDMGEIERPRANIAPAPVVIPTPEVKQASAIIPEPTIVPVTSEVKAEPAIDSAPKSVKFEKAETKNCYVNQVIPGDYRGKIAELVQNSKESKVGYVQELPTLCKKDRSTEIITKLQRALYGLGYLKGGASSINGAWDKNTLNAVRAYQKAKGLAYGQLSIEMLETLNVL